MQILVTGGTGYIGSHTVVELVEAGHDVVIIDNFLNSKKSVLKRLNKITGKDIPLVEADLKDLVSVAKIFEDYNIDGVIHFAGLKAVSESKVKPLDYYRNNIDSSLTLCEVMQQYNVKKLIFSSSATVYGEPSELPLKETSRTGVGITNPYGQTKYMIEQIFHDLCSADNSWQITSLRYFNPIGAHESGIIGEDPNGTPNNLLPFIQQVAGNKLDKLRVFGNNYDTPDGTGVRDYIHVVDLAKGHLAALQKMYKSKQSTAYNIYNLGTGKGTSVLELLNKFEKIYGQTIPYEFAPRRPGDIAVCIADSTKAKAELGWDITKSIEDACRDSWRWQQYAITHSA